jgi:hypothetical protein
MTKVPARLKTALADRYTRDSQKAVEYYDKFVELWKDADPELQPVVRDMRARIARLVGER